MENKIMNIEKRLDETTRDIKELNKKVAEIDKGIAGSNIDIKYMFGMLEDIKESTAKINIEVLEIKNKPGKKWENMQGIITSVVITAVVSFFIGRLL